MTTAKQDYLKQNHKLKQDTDSDIMWIHTYIPHVVCEYVEIYLLYKGSGNLGSSS